MDSYNTRRSMKRTREVKQMQQKFKGGRLLFGDRVDMEEKQVSSSWK